MKKIIPLLIILLSNGAVHAQYLKVSRSATVKEQPQRKATIIERVKKGDYLILLEDGNQVNGYYKVEANSVNKDGWIYRTLVRRYDGSIPGSSVGGTYQLTFEPAPESYYTGAENLTGEALKTALYNIIKGHKEYSYTNIWDMLKETDRDTLNYSNVIGLYSGFSMVADAQYDNGKGWNREHVWAKSFGDFGTTMGPGTDIHHLRAADVSTNSARNNRSFDESEKLYIDMSGTYSGETASYTSEIAWTWEPRDEVKGDVARMIFYMAVRYEGENYEPDLELVDTINDRTSKEPVHGRVSVLLNWHNDDPVSRLEKFRNHIIFTNYQHNRNPFIDHPEYVSLIWGDGGS